MAKFQAIFVEDDAEHAITISAILHKADFEVHSYSSAQSILDDIDRLARPVDVAVLDRRLPAEPLADPNDTTGDELLEALIAELPDTHIVLLTGFASYQHAQLSKNRGELSVLPGEEGIDRVSYFSKDQFSEFAAHVNRLSEKLRELSEVDLNLKNRDVSELSVSSKRLLRKVCVRYGGAAIEAFSLDGGLSETAVWRCRIIAFDGSQTASLVVKEAREKSTKAGGIQTLVTATAVAGVIDDVSGFCDGYHGQIAQLANHDAVSLLEYTENDEAAGARVLELLADALDSLPSSTGVLTLEHLATPLISWDKLEERLRPWSVTLPSRTLRITSNRSEQHGDLHPLNVLVSSERPVLIDFDNQLSGSRLIDPVAMVLGSLFNRSSPLREGEWPSGHQCANFSDDDIFLDCCPWPSFFRAGRDWYERRAASRREYCAMLLIYAARQLKYADICEVERMRERALGFVTGALAMLSDS